MPRTRQKQLSPTCLGNKRGGKLEVAEATAAVKVKETTRQERHRAVPPETSTPSPSAHLCIASCSLERLLAQPSRTGMGWHPGQDFCTTVGCTRLAGSRGVRHHPGWISFQLPLAACVQTPVVVQYRPAGLLWRSWGGLWKGRCSGDKRNGNPCLFWVNGRRFPAPSSPRLCQQDGQEGRPWWVAGERHICIQCTNIRTGGKEQPRWFCPL